MIGAQSRLARRRDLRLGLLLVGSAVLVGCESGIFPEADLERMINQEKAQAYQPSVYFEDGRLMRPPPPSSVSREVQLGPPEIVEAVAGGNYVATIPRPLTREMLERGRDRFELFCAACHGVRGNADTWVARSMMLRKPRQLTDETVRAFPPGRIFLVATDGYGLMRSYAHELSVDDRWSVVAYLRALQLSEAVPLRELPPETRRRVQEKLR